MKQLSVTFSGFQAATRQVECQTASDSHRADRSPNDPLSFLILVNEALSDHLDQGMWDVPRSFLGLQGGEE